MSLETFGTSPSLEDFTPLSEYTSQTPTSFFPNKAVLHFHAPNSTIKLPHEQYLAQTDFQRFSSNDIAPPPTNSDNNGEVHLEGVDVWVTSRNVLLFSPAKSEGLRISYPTITVTAQDREDVLLELNLSDADAMEEDIQFVQIRIVVGGGSGHAAAAAAGGGAAEEGESDGAGGEANGTTTTTARHNDDDDDNVSAAALFKAISDCQELNPDPPQEGEDGEEGMDLTAPGATGWITSENMGAFMDENGEFRMPEGMTVIGGEEEDQGLGEGAGRTRAADELDAADGADEGDESKWQRTG